MRLRRFVAVPVALSAFSLVMCSSCARRERTTSAAPAPSAEVAADAGADEVPVGTTTVTSVVVAETNDVDRSAPLGGDRRTPAPASTSTSPVPPPPRTRVPGADRYSIIAAPHLSSNLGLAADGGAPRAPAAPPARAVDRVPREADERDDRDEPRVGPPSAADPSSWAGSTGEP